MTEKNPAQARCDCHHCLTLRTPAWQNPLDSPLVTGNALGGVPPPPQKRELSPDWGPPSFEAPHPEDCPCLPCSAWRVFKWVLAPRQLSVVSLLLGLLSVLIAGWTR